ncbi:MAG: YkgJ family cysteine cluster protein [Desulfuromonadaceae bacterium]|nr:YkgJ family cysteine cluster protein [Desulfuromonadaceae bacterium]MDD5107041.1 YkgJ family cysteine cluster protein [Desulfuromonadaceae bacterium]
MNELLDRYGALLREVDAWFQQCQERHPEQIACHNGCSSCCRGLFDITLLDAYYLRYGFNALPIDQKIDIRQAASQLLALLSRVNTMFVKPWLLNSIPEEQWDALMPEEDETPCLLLSKDGRCLVYEYRPMTCRLNGIPLIDISGEEFFDEWCTLNFTGADPREFMDLRFPFTELFTRELLFFQEFTCLLGGKERNEVDLFIPAAIVMDEVEIVLALAQIPI